MNSLWAVRLASGNLMGGLYVHGCHHVADGHDPRCSIQTADAVEPENGLFFGDRRKAKAAAALCPDGATVVRVEPQDTRDGEA